MVPKDGSWHPGTSQYIASRVAGKKLSAKVINTDKYTAVMDVTVPGDTKTLNKVSRKSHIFLAFVNLIGLFTLGLTPLSIDFIRITMVISS